METFIENVRAHPCLWNPLHPEYRDMPVRDQAWQEVVKQCKNNSIPNVKAARLEWRKLRDNHREALKRAKLGQNKLLPAQITTWKYAKLMQFLEPHMKYRITEDIEMDMQPFEASIKYSEPDVSTTEIVEHGNIGNVVSENRNNKRPRRCTECSYESSPPRQRQRRDSDALESFFNCIQKSSREMPHWMQTQVKKKIFAVIIEAEESLSHSQHEQNPTYRGEYENYCPSLNKIKEELCENSET